MIKASMTTKEAASPVSPSTLSPEELVRTGAGNGAFAQMLAMAHAQTTALPKTDNAPTTENATEEAIGVRFAGQKAQAAVGGKAAAQRAKSVHGHAAVGAGVLRDAWEETKAQHRSALKQVPGLGLSSEEAGAKMVSDAEMAHDALAAQKAKARGMSLNGKDAQLRADGSPVLRDESGTTLSVNAQYPDTNLGVYLAKEGKNALEDGRLSELQRGPNGKTQKSLATNEAFMESAAAHKTTRVAQHAAAISAATQTPQLEAKDAAPTVQQAVSQEDAIPVKAASTDRKTSSSAAQKEALLQETQKATAPATPGSDANAQGFGHNGKGDEPEKHLAAELSKSRNGAASLGVVDATTTLDATRVAQAITKGDAPLAGARLAELLGARLELLTRGNERSLTLTLTPRELGEIRAQLVTNGETTDVHLKAEKESIGKSLEAALPELSRLMQKAGVTVGQISIEYGLADFTQSGNGQPQSSKDDPGNGGFAFELEGTPQATETNKTARTAPTRDNGVIDVVA